MQVTGPAAAAAAQSLAVDGDLAAFHGETETGEVGGDAGGEGGGLDGLEDAGEGVGAGDAVGQREPFAQPFFLQLAELFHEFVGSHAAEHGGEGDEEDLAEMVAGVAAVARVADGREDFEACGEASGIVGFVGISGHPGTLKPQGKEYKSVKLLPVVASLMELPLGKVVEFSTCSC